MYSPLQGRIQILVQGGGFIFFLSRGAQHPLGHENPLKSIDFILVQGGLAPIAAPGYAAVPFTYRSNIRIQW